MRQSPRPESVGDRLVVPATARALVAVTAVAVAALAVGAFLRAWYLAHDGLDADDAVVGLMARSILHGHQYVFYWGQRYGGTPEVYLVAALMAVVGGSGFAVDLTAALLSGVAAVLTWRIARRLTGTPGVALLAGVLVWVAPEAWVWYSTTEDGFRRMTMVAGLVCMLVALRVLDGHRGVAEFAGLGLAAGIGWWSSPELAYYLVPTGLPLVAAVAGRGARRERGWPWVPRLVVVTVGFLVGSLPWWRDNVRSRFASLSSSGAPGLRGFGYGRRLQVFFVHTFLMETDLVVRGSGATLAGNRGGSELHHLAMLALIAVVAAVLAACFVLCLLEGGRGLAIAAGVVAFPFIYAYSSATWYWQDGRYGVYLAPLLALMLAMGIDQGLVRLRARRRRQPRRGTRPVASAAVAMAGCVAACSVLTLLSFHRVGRLDADPLGLGQTTPAVGGAQLATGWTDPNRPVEQIANALERDGIRRGFANYWVAYPLDFFGDGRLAISAVPDRSVTVLEAASRGTGQAWLFGGPGRTINLSRTTFVAELRHRRWLYRSATVGPLRIVIPAGRATPATLRRRV